MKTRFPTTSGKSSETVGNRPPSRTLPRRLPPTPKGVGGEVVGNLRIWSTRQRRKSSQFCTLCGPCRKSSHAPHCKPDGKAMFQPCRRRKAGAWGPRLPRGASGRIREGGRQGRRYWTRHRAVRRKAHRIASRTGRPCSNPAPQPPGAPEGGGMGAALAAWRIRPDRGRR